MARAMRFGAHGRMQLVVSPLAIAPLALFLPDLRHQDSRWSLLHNLIWQRIVLEANVTGICAKSDFCRGGVLHKRGQTLLNCRVSEKQSSLPYDAQDESPGYQMVAQQEECGSQTGKDEEVKRGARV